MSNTLFAFFERNKHIFLGGIIFIIVSANAQYGQFDFWEHAAAIKSLMVSFANPPHPYIQNSFLPHHFYSPYHVALAQIGKWLSLDNMDILFYAGFFNLIGFLTLFYFFLKHTFDLEPADCGSIYFFSIILMLFFWGSKPWMWSGFYHFKFIREQIFMPSSFAFNLVLLTVILTKRILLSKKWYFYPYLVILNFFIILIHPNTFVAGFILCLALVFSNGIKRNYLQFMLILLLGILSIWATRIWPYYDIFKLVGSTDTKYFNDDSYTFYTNIFRVIWPSFIIIVFLFTYYKRTRNAYILFSVAGLTCIYLLGFVTKIYGLGRIISFICILLAINFTIEFVERLYVKKGIVGKFTYIFIFLGVIFSLQLGLTLDWSADHINTGKSELETVIEVDNKCKEVSSFRSGFLHQIGDNDLILARLNLSRYFCAYGGKYLAIDRPEYFVPNINTRRTEVSRFFDLATTDTTRSRILTKYHPDYLLLNKWSHRKQNDIISFADRNGNLMFEDQCFLLYYLDYN